MAPPASVEELWTVAQLGSMPPLEQMKAFALREVVQSFDVHIPNSREGKVPYQWIADRVQVYTGDRTVQRPERDAVRCFFERVDADPNWYPGKTYHTKKRGRKPLLHKGKRRAIASAMMAAKDRGLEPTSTLAMQLAPAACVNPLTDLPFTKKYLCRVLSQDCYDDDPNDPWRFGPCLQKTWLPPEVRAQRHRWALKQKENAELPVWYFNNIIWYDPNGTIIPAGPKKAADQKQLAKGSRRWRSEKSKTYSRNMQGPKYAKSQKGWGDRRYKWILVLVRGRLEVEVMPEGWSEDGEGMALFVNKHLPRVLNRALGSSAVKPKVIYTDRGSGMYIPKTGKVTAAYGEAVHNRGFRLYSGDEFADQPSDLADILLHETAAATFRKRLTATPPVVKPWLESHKQFKKRVAGVVAEANRKMKLQRLCCEYPARIDLLIQKNGDRLRK